MLCSTYFHANRKYWQNIAHMANDTHAYGYYTIHTVDKDGNILGMLSVNGFSGDVWYHSWHGVFIDMQEYN